MGILLVADMLENYEISSHFFDKGNPILWGCVGWCALGLFIYWLGRQFISYYSKKLELRREKETYISEKEKNRVELDQAELEIEKRKRKYKRKRRELEKELKQKEEMKRKLVKDFMPLFIKKKKVVQGIEELEKGIKDLEKDLSNLYERMEKDIDTLINICEEKQNNMEECIRQIDEVELKLEKNKKEFMGNIMKKTRAVCVGLVVVLLADGNNMLATAKELMNTIAESFDSSEELRMDESESEEPILEDVSPEKTEENSEVSSDTESVLREHTDYHFIIEDEQLHKKMDKDVEDIIFLTAYSKNAAEYDRFLTVCREGNIMEILPEVNGNDEPDVDDLLNEIAEKLEKPFLEKIDKGKMAQTQMEWEKTVPKSTELENIMDKRKLALGLEESIPSRRKIYFLLANDYQRLGIECLIQGKDGTQIYYNYGMSIYYCYCALGYEWSGDKSCSDETILNYVMARYKDIADNEKVGIPAEKVNSAEKIYSLFN